MQAQRVSCQAREMTPGRAHARAIMRALAPALRLIMRAAAGTAALNQRTWCNDSATGDESINDVIPASSHGDRERCVAFG